MFIQNPLQRYKLFTKYANKDIDLVQNNAIFRKIYTNTVPNPPFLTNIWYTIHL